MGLGINQAAAGLVGGMGGGIAQAYATMGKLSYFVFASVSVFCFPFCYYL